MNRLLNKVRQTAGYTLDQTILIVAIIAILITLIILTVGWDLITRAGGTKLAAQLRQVEDATGSFYGDNGLWMHQALLSSGRSAGLSTSPRYIIGALVEPTYFGATGDWQTDHINYLSGFSVEGSGTNARLIHNFGSGGQVTMGIVDMSGNNGSRTIRNGSYYVIQFANVPQGEAEKAKEQIDGDFASDEEIQGGRVTFRTATTAADAYGCNNASQMNQATFDAAGTVDICFAANLLN